MKTLDDRNLVLNTPDARYEFLMEMYVTHVLGHEVKSPFDLIASNDVEDLSFNTRKYQLMQQYTVYPVYELYKLTWDKFFEQSMQDMEFQIRMAKKFQEESKAGQKDLLGGENTVAVDESHQIDLVTNEVSRIMPFKKNF